MSKVNLDVADRLDITCRRGDTFELTLTLKDSSGTALPLLTDEYTFLMEVRKSVVSNASRRSVQRIGVPTGGEGGNSDDDNSITDGAANTENIVIGSVEGGVKGPVNFTFNDKDDSGNVTVFVSALEMRKVPAGKYKYDLQYNVGSRQKTILEGRFTVNDDISKAL
jgi:hypothetical protein